MKERFFPFFSLVQKIKYNIFLNKLFKYKRTLTLKTFTVLPTLLIEKNLTNSFYNYFAMTPLYHTKTS